MKKIKTSILHENQITNNLYVIDSQFEDFLKSIELDGILEPLIVQPYLGKDGHYEVISGNRRLRVARLLNIDEVPVIIKEYEVITENLSIAHQQYREKKNSEILRELKSIRERYGLKQGVRSDLDPEVKKGQELKKQLEKRHSKSKLDRLIQIDKKLEILSTEDPNIRDKEIKRLDQSGSIHGTLKRLNKKVEEKENREKIGDHYQIIRDDIQVYQKSSDDLSNIKDNSVAAIITSPPYFNIRDYKLGKGELGHEVTPDDFVTNLVNHFDDSKRVLSKKGTMWVNLGDYLYGHGYSAVPEKFLLQMLSRGWLLHDKIIWVKNNPQYGNDKRSTMAYEFIYVFKKSPFVQFDTTWVSNYKEEFGFISYGDKTIKSVFNFRDNILITNGAQNHDLKEECKRKGYNLTHSATFPISVPSIAILTSSEPGDLILDIFHGTGTTAKSAQLLGRKYVGYELNPTYIKQSEIRLDMPYESNLDIAA